MSYRLIRCLLLTMACAITAPAFAQLVPPIEKHRYWGVYANGNGSDKVCFVMSLPYDSEPKNVRRGPIYFYVTTRPGEGVRNEPSMAMGYPLSGTSPASIVIDGEKSFTLKTEGETAWVANPAEEALIIDAMKAGREMVVKGTSTRGTQTADTYSLSGITAALGAMGQQCP